MAVEDASALNHEHSSLDRDRLGRLLAVGRGLISELRLEQVLDRLLDTARELTGARYAALGILDESRTSLARFVTRGVDADTRRAIGDLPHGRGVLGVLIEHPEPLRLRDVTAHPGSFGFPPGHPPMESFLGVPVIIRGKAWGNLYLTEKDGAREFDATDEESVIVLAAWAAIAIENARLYETLDARRVELEQAVRGFEATSAIARALGAETDLDRVLELIVTRARALVHARSVLVLLREDDDLVIAAAAGQVTSADERTRVSETRCGDVIELAQPLRIDDVDSETRLSSAQLGVPDASTALLVPLVYRARVLGVLCAFDRTQGEPSFDRSDEGVLTAFAASAATAVATARTVESDRLRAALESAESERRRWARELHDETLQSLGALKVSLAGAARVDDPERLRAAVADAVEHVALQIESLRSLITELRPASLDALGLAPALSTLIDDARAAHDVDIDAKIDLGERLPLDFETAVYRVVQEALTNAGKHAGASRVEVSVVRAQDEIHVSVRDDGAGFDHNAPTSGFGLLGMRERVALTGGSLELERTEPGTRISARFPLPGSRA